MQNQDDSQTSLPVQGSGVVECLQTVLLILVCGTWDYHQRRFLIWLVLVTAPFLLQTAGNAVTDVTLTLNVVVRALSGRISITTWVVVAKVEAVHAGSASNASCVRVQRLAEIQNSS